MRVEINTWQYLLAELHGDMFSHPASPLQVEVYVFVAVDERGEHITSDEICRPCNGKQQRKRHGDRSVQLPDLVYDYALFFETFIYARTRTCYVHDQICSAKKKQPLRSGLGMDTYVCSSH